MMASAHTRLMTAVDLTLPVKRKKLEFHNLAENVSLWNII